MNKYDDDYRYTYSELTEDEFISRLDWLEYLSPQAIEAYNEYIEDTSYKEAN